MLILRCMEIVYQNQSSKLGGTYGITNKANGKVYYGSTKCFQVRASQHLKHLEDNKHGNMHLQAAFNIDGTNKFVFEVIEVVGLGKQARLDAEQLLLDAHWDDGISCYNIRKNAQSKEGSKDKDTSNKRKSDASKLRWKNRSQDQRKIIGDKISKSQKGRKDPRTDVGKQKQITSIKGKTWNLGRKRTEKSKKKMSISHKGKFIGTDSPRAKTYENIRLVSPIGELFVTIACGAEFAREHNLNPKNLNQVLNRRRKSHKGWKLEILEINQID